MIDTTAEATAADHRAWFAAHSESHGLTTEDPAAPGGRRPLHAGELCDALDTWGRVHRAARDARDTAQQATAGAQLAAITGLLSALETIWDMED